MKDYFSLAFNNLKRRKLRAWLTMIGIFIGIAAVVSLISLGQGLQNYITGEFEKLGSDKILIQPKSLGPPGSSGSETLILKEKDLKIVEDTRGVEWAIGMLAKQGQVKYKEQAEVGFIFGINPDGLEKMKSIQNIEIIDGRQLKKDDRFKAVVGYNHIYGEIWDKPLKLGNSLEIEGHEFKVVGVYKKIGNPYDDGAVYLTKDVLREILNIGDEESQIMVKTADGFDPEVTAETIERKLRQARGEKEGQETFRVQTSEQLLNTFQSIFAVVQGVLVGIAAISLLVGGIGIMNTMYTSVLERTKEIGTMKAVGAKNSDILLLFLFESGLLGLAGGIIGVIIGLGLSKSAEYIATAYIGTPLLQASLDPMLILGALAFSFVVGSISGVLPAMQAARLKPADALRYE